MNKILGIIVLSLLLSGNAYANKNENIKIDLIFCKSSGGNKEVYLKDTFDGSCPPSQPIEITFKKFKKKYGWQIGKQLCYLPYEKKSERVFLTPGGSCNRIIQTAIKIKRKGGDYYYYGNKESEKKKREELADKKKAEEEKKIAEKEKKKPEVSPDDNKVVPAGSGSGFFVSSEGHIITNHHVIDGCNTTKVNFKGNQIDTQILAVDKANDIAILITNIKPERIFSVSNNDVSLLDDIIVAGFPLTKISSAIKTSKGVVTALAGSGDNYSEFQTDTVINAGNSGGPIINQKGNVVGIAVSSWIEEGVEGFHFGIKSSTLRTFANSNSLKLTQANNIELSNKDLGKLIIEATVYLECHMTVADIKKMMAAENNQKAFFSEFK